MDYYDKLYELGITLTTTGRQTCPKCSHDRKKSSDKCLSVTFENDVVLYNCHHCGWNGAVKKTNYMEKLFTKPIKPATQKTPLNMYLYFAKRCITKGTLNNYKIACNDKNEIIIPYYKDGELVNIKYRTNLPDGKKAFRQEKNTEKTLFGMDLVDTNKPLIFVEGEMDVLALAEQGINAVSVPNGGNDKELDCLNNCYKFVNKFKSYIIAVDKDEVGNTLKNNLINRLGKSNCSIVDWGQYKDANEALMAKEDLHKFIDNAKQIAPDGIITYENNLENIRKSIFEEDNDYYPTGWTELDRILKLRLGYLMVVTGYPSRGKSTFVNNMLVNLTKKYGFKHLIASFETTTEGSYIELLEMYKEKSIDLIKYNKEEVFDEFDIISKHFLRLDVSKQWSIDEIIKITEMMVTKYGINTLVIDPYNRLKNEYKEREDKYIGSILSKLCMLTKKLNILIIFVAHPKKPDDEELPTMYSISGSSDWYNMADYGIIVHRERNEITEELTNEPIIYVAKVKNHLLGKPSGGVVKLKYNLNKRILVNK